MALNTRDGLDKDADVQPVRLEVSEKTKGHELIVLPLRAISCSWFYGFINTIKHL